MNIENLCMSFQTQVIFDNVNIHMNDTDHIGLVGVNGAGKSTLFNLILGKLEPEKGKIVINNNYRIGYLPQVITDELPFTNISVFDYLLLGRPIDKLKDKLNNLYIEISNIIDDKELNNKYREISRVQSLLEYYDEYNAENTLLKIISGMGISDELLNLDIRQVSGGQKSKIAFARLIYSNPEILLLDEPTNHLDEISKEFIIDYIKKYKGLVLVISHDIDFLEKVTNKTMYVDKIKHNIELFNGNYSKYLKIKEERDLSTKRLYEKQVKEEEKLKKIISKYIRGNEKKANIAKDRIKKLERLEKEKVELEKKNKYAKIKVSVNYPSYKIPFSVNSLTFGYTLDNLLYKDLTFDITRGEKFLIVGENGIGKSTLLKLIMKELTPINGSINYSDKTNIAYYSQEHEGLIQDKSILDNFSEYNIQDYELRKLLGSFLFTGDDIYKKIKVLSPGERSRVALAKISLSGANVIILDEPTNHLDPMTQLIIADTFKSFEGTLLVVSHNLEFVDNLGINRMLLLPSGRIIYYDREVVMSYEMLEEGVNE